VDFQELVEAQVTQESLVLLVHQVKHFTYLPFSKLQNIAGALYYMHYYPIYKKGKTVFVLIMNKHISNLNFGAGTCFFNFESQREAMSFCQM
jgi:hypothetical protein